MKIITLGYDPDIENPSEWDGQWSLYSFNRRHNSYADPERFFPNSRPSIGLRRKLDVGLAFTLAYEEHGRARWLRAERYAERNPWNTNSSRGLLVWEHPPREMGARTMDERRADADHFLETYNTWVNGEGFYFTVEDDLGGDERALVDSVGGFFGNDLAHMFDQIREAIGDDPDFEFTGEAAYLGDDFVPREHGPKHGPWTPREAFERGTMDEPEVAVWSDYVSEHGREEQGINALSPEELARLRRKLK